MKPFLHLFEFVKIARHLLVWTALIIPLSVSVGCSVAIFLTLLDWVTFTRQSHIWLIFCLPLAGLFISFLYKRYGKNTEAGNNLILQEIHQPGGGIPFRMMPLIVTSTLITHLFGGSAGREGTAVQMGGSFAYLFADRYRLKSRERRILLMCGIAAGFGAVFGTPLTGAIFAIEVLAIGRIHYDGLLPCLIAGVIADKTCTALGIHHTLYKIVFNRNAHLYQLSGENLLLLLKIIVAGIAFGLCAYVFSQAVHFIRSETTKHLHKNLVPVAGGLLVIVIAYALGTFDYLGLGVSSPQGGVSILSAFHPDGATYWSWFWKLLLTAITIGTGFKGGEVTPLFFIGATLGNTLATVSGAPIDLFAGLGFIAVFAGATNTPLACTIMGVELFGAENTLYYAIACFSAYYFSGHRGIYSTQRLVVSKYPDPTTDVN